MLLPTLAQEDTGEVSLFSIRPDCFLFGWCDIGEFILVHILSHTFQQHLVLSSNSNSVANIHLGVELLAPLRVRLLLLAKGVERHLLIICGSKRVLVLCLRQDSLLDQSTQSQRIVGCACSRPIGILLHFVLKKLGALPHD